MDDAATPDRLAERLRQAYLSGPVAPLRDGLAPNDEDGAYAVQTINTRLWQDQGRRIVGRKIGLTAKAVQAQFGVNQPDFGVLFADMQIGDGQMLRAAGLHQPRAEAEIALVLAKDIRDPAPTPETLAAAVDHVVAAIEIVDSRIADWQISFADTVADNGSAAFFVLGQQRQPLKGLDLYSCGMVMELNGSIASLGAGAACLGHPLNAAAWLAAKSIDQGEPLRAGDIILTGALGPMVAIQPGDWVTTHIGGIGSATFTYGEAP